MKKFFATILAFVMVLFTAVSLGGCDVTDALDLALENEELIQANEQLEQENAQLKSELATLKFQVAYPDNTIGGEDIVELKTVVIDVGCEAGDAVVVTDKAQVTINGGSYNGGQTPFGGAGNTAVWANSVEAKVTINDGYFYINGLATDEEGNKDTGHIDLIYCSAGVIEINGGWFEGADSDVWLLNCNDTSYLNGTASIIVNGGTFVNFDPSNCLTESVKDENGIQIPVSYVAEGFGVVSEVIDGKTLYRVVPESEIPETSEENEGLIEF